MKILWLTSAEKNSFGHSELFGLSESLIKKGHDVTVIASSKEKRQKEGHIVYVKRRFNRLRLFKLKLAICLPWWMIFKRPDVIIVDWQSAFVPIIPLLLSKLGLHKINLIHDVRTIPVNDSRPRGEKLFRLCMNISKKHFIGITTITTELKDKICSDYNIPSEKVGVWNSGVDLNLFYPRDASAKRKELGLDGKFIVFYHGSLGYRRGVIEVVEAFSRLKNKSDDIVFFILGSGLEMETIRKIKETETLENVHIHSPVKYDEVPDYIAMADVCIVPLPNKECWRVSSPLKVMEYLAMGKAIILTDIIAHRKIIQNREEAFFIPDINAHTLYTAIERAYGMRKHLWRMGEASLRHAKENCSWDIQAERLVEYLYNLQSWAKQERRNWKKVEHVFRS